MDKNELDCTKLSTIVAIIDGDSIYTNCGLGLSKCTEEMPCPLHDQFKLLREDLKRMLEQTTVKSLTHNLEKGLTFLKRYYYEIEPYKKK